MYSLLVHVGTLITSLLLKSDVSAFRKIERIRFSFALLNQFCICSEYYVIKM